MIHLAGRCGRLGGQQQGLGEVVDMGKCQMVAGAANVDRASSTQQGCDARGEGGIARSPDGAWPDHDSREATLTVGRQHDPFRIDLAGCVRIAGRWIVGTQLVHRGALPRKTQDGHRAHMHQSLDASVLTGRYHVARAVRVGPEEFAPRAPVRHLGCGVKHHLLTAGSLTQRHEVAYITAHNLYAQARQAAQVARSPNQGTHPDPAPAKGRYQTAAEEAGRPGD